MGAPPGTITNGSRAPTSTGPGLQQRAEAADENVALIRFTVRPAEVERLADQEDRGDRRRRHHEHVLEAEQDQPAPREDLVDGVYGLRHRASQGWAERFPLVSRLRSF